ncbi:putative uncharacterized protein [Firmicutes bacterium CAG:449]|nr:putative uncharacterized protein [Firmicutes bacterium CAG:449]
MKNLIKILKGVLIGIAAIVPGFSGGTIACIVNCYDEIIEAISDIKSHFKKSIITLLPYLLGILIGACSLFPISWGINNYPLITISLFAGLLIGSLPSFYLNIKGKANKTNLLSSFICGGVFLILIIVNLFVGSGNYVDISLNPWWAYIVMIIVGAIGSAALVVPGISGSMVLMIMGFYNPLMDTIKGFLSSVLLLMGINASFDFASSNMLEVIGKNYILPSLGLLVCFVIGVILGFYLISKLMKYLLSKHRDATYFAIFAFIVVSLVAIYAVESYYQNLSAVKIILAIVFLILGFCASYFLTKLADKKKGQEDVSR